MSRRCVVMRKLGSKWKAAVAKTSSRTANTKTACGWACCVPNTRRAQRADANESPGGGRRCLSMVGWNRRFEPVQARVEQFLDERRLGAIRFARLHVGSYLPEWRPRADYRQNYAAKAETGGGCMLDCIHEIELARWYL